MYWTPKCKTILTEKTKPVLMLILVRYCVSFKWIDNGENVALSQSVALQMALHYIQCPVIYRNCCKNSMNWWPIHHHIFRLSKTVCARLKQTTDKFCPYFSFLFTNQNEHIFNHLSCVRDDLADFFFIAVVAALHLSYVHLFILSFFLILLILRTSLQTIGQRISIKRQTILFYLTYIYYKNKYRFYFKKILMWNCGGKNLNLYIFICFLPLFSYPQFLCVHFISFGFDRIGPIRLQFVIFVLCVIFFLKSITTLVVSLGKKHIWIFFHKDKLATKKNIQNECNSNSKSNKSQFGYWITATTESKNTAKITNLK